MLHQDATKQLLTQALKTLMAQKPLHKISIREITELCGVNRQTFYYHFEDIYDQVRWMYRQEALELLRRQDGVLVWQDGLLQLFRYLEENRAVCLCTLNSLGRDALRRFFFSDIYDILHRTIDTMARDLPGEDPGYKDMLTHFYISALSGMMESWLRGELPYTPETLVHMADTLITDQYEGAKHRLNIPPPPTE